MTTPHHDEDPRTTDAERLEYSVDQIGDDQTPADLTPPPSEPPDATPSAGDEPD